ncbi:ATP-binding protein [Streptomyces sp. NPDC087843]|uniref:ATP-binding protein n=1 Tax=Streptomyces sp. NPDC087843 TaxID=3365804 RepID=UPI0037FB05FA
MQMQLATSPPAARAPVAWYSWWLMPVALGAGTVATAVAGPDQVQIPAAFAGTAATTAGAICVRLLLRTRSQLRRSAADIRGERAERSQEWQRHVAALEREFAAERAVLDAQLADRTRTFETRLAEQTQSHENRIAEQTEDHEARLAERSEGYEARLAEQTRTHEARLAEEIRTHEARLAEEIRTHEARLSEQARAHDARIAEQAEAHETGIAARTQVWQERLAVQLAVVGRLGDTYLPDALERLRAGEAVDDILPEVAQETDAGPELRAELRKILRTALIGVEAEFDRSTSAEQAVISIGSRMHVLTSKLRGRLHEMQGEHGRLPAVARGLMELDQEIGPADCLAASIGVLGGSDRPGRQWQEPQRLLSVVRGGIGRIKDFGRVQVRHLPELGVDGALVDHLTLLFAHLLDNAARYSPPTEPVVVSGREVPNGVGIEIQDAGNGLSEEKRNEAAHTLAGTSAGPGLGGISEDANLGLRVVGTLARRYGIRVTFADSPWLGTSVVVVVPHKYFSPLPVTVTDPAPAAGTATDRAATGDESADTTSGGLPRRRGRRTGAPDRRPGTASRPGATPRPGAVGRTEESVAAVPPAASFTGLAAFATAGRDSGPPHGAAAARESDEHRTEESD